MAGSTLAELRAEGIPANGLWRTEHFSAKEAVLPFNRFPDTDALLGPEMRSTGEVMGIDVTPGLAFLKSQLAAGTALAPDSDGVVFLSLADRDKEVGIEVARALVGLGHRLVATAGTAAALTGAGLEVERVLSKIIEGESGGGATALDLIAAGEVALVINTPRGRGARADGSYIRTAAAQEGVPLVTTVAAAAAVARGMADWTSSSLEVRSLQDIHSGMRATE